MNLLITGGLGHIGTFFLQNVHKIKKIKRIYVIDKLEEKILNIINLNYKKKINFIDQDLTKKKINFKNKIKFSAVIHLASLTDPSESMINNKFTIKHNLKCFMNVLEYCKKNKIPLVHISSTSIYGSKNLNIDEKCKELIPQSPYAKAKIMEEKMLKKTDRSFKYITLRFGTIVGPSPGMRFHTAANKFCMQAFLDRPFAIWKTALFQYRPYLSIRDSFNTFKFILEKKVFNREIYNIVSENLTVLNVINKIRKYKSSKLRLVKSNIMNNLSYKVSTLKIKNIGLNINSRILKDIENNFKFLNKRY